MSDPIADTPAAEPSGQEALNALTPEQRSTWELTGDWPEPAKVTTTAAEPGGEVEEGAETATAVEAKAAPIDDASKAYTKPNSRSKRTEKDQEFINERIRTSVREATERLQAEIAELKAKAAPAAEPQKKEPESAPQFQPTRPKPQEAEFETYADYVEAVSDWKIEQWDAKRVADATAASAKARQTAAEHERSLEEDRWSERRDAFAATNPAFVEKAIPFLDRVTSGTPLGDVLLKVSVGPELALHLAENPEEVKRIVRLDPVQQIYALGEIGSQFKKDTVTSASASAGPAAKTVTTAPAPPTTLSARSASPADPAAAALERGDYAAFEAEENRRAVASAR